MSDLGMQYLAMQEYSNRNYELEKIAERNRLLVESRRTPVRRLRRMLRINNNHVR